MREIKFRGKRKSDGQWIFGDLIHHHEKNNSYILEKNRGMLFSEEVAPKTVGEYTGLKDRGGVEIYEEDIVKEGWNGVVKAIDDIRSVDWLLSDGFLAGQEGPNKELIDAEVIGNIYDNPELLTN